MSGDSVFTLLAFLVILQGLGCSANDCSVKRGPLRWVCSCRRRADEWVTALMDAER